jgi:pimeloyl-ACP methyl ester carboxylesterase
MAERECVVLVHGLWMHGLVMSLMRRSIERCGYRAISYSYPSIRLGLQENAQRLARFCRELGVPRAHFVGHSLGGLVVLCLLEQAAGLVPGRIVLLGPPYAGCHAAHRLGRLPGGRAALGRSIPEWLESGRPAPHGGHEIGVICGNVRFGLGCLVAPDLPAPSDGVVSAAETHVPGMRDHIVLGVSHSGMLVSRAVARQVCAFLHRGAFAKDEG